MARKKKKTPRKSPGGRGKKSVKRKIRRIPKRSRKTRKTRKNKKTSRKRLSRPDKRKRKQRVKPTPKRSRKRREKLPERRPSSKPKIKAAPTRKDTRQWANYFNEIGSGFCRYIGQKCQTTVERNSDGSVDADIEVPNKLDEEPDNFIFFLGESWIWPGDSEAWIIILLNFRVREKIDDKQSPYFGKSLVTICTYPVLSTEVGNAMVAAHNIARNMSETVEVSLTNVTIRLHWNRYRQSPGRPRWCL